MIDNQLILEKKKEYLLYNDDYKVYKIKETNIKDISSIAKSGKISYFLYFNGKEEKIILSKDTDLIYNYFLKLNLKVEKITDQGIKFVVEHDNVSISEKKIVINDNLIEFEDNFLSFSNLYNLQEDGYIKINVSFKIEGDDNTYFVKKKIENIKNINIKLNENVSIKTRKNSLFFVYHPVLKEKIEEKVNLLEDNNNNCEIISLKGNYKVEDILEKKGKLYVQSGKYTYVIKNSGMLLKYYKGELKKKEILKIIRKKENITTSLVYKIKNKALKIAFKLFSYNMIANLNFTLKIAGDKSPYRYYVENMDKLDVKKNTVLLEGFNGNEFNGNMYALLIEYQKLGFDICVSIKDKTNIQSVLEAQNIKVKYCQTLTKKYYKKLITSEYIVTDTTLPRFFIKNKDQKVINTWHGTPIKNMGKNIESSPFALANSQRNFFLTDLLTFSNNYTIDIMKNSYMLQDKNIQLLPSARNSLLFKEKETKVKRVLWMPTWRESKENAILLNINLFKRIKEIEEEVLQKDQKLEFYVKPHQMIADILKRVNISFKEIPDNVELYDFLNTVDILITDYSSIMFDFANKNQKIILDVYDIEEYKKERGLIFDVHETPFTILSDKDEIVKEILKDKVNANYKEFNNIYNPYDSLKGAKEVVAQTLKQFKDNDKTNAKENVLIYPGTLLTNGITTSFLNLLSNLDKDKYNYTIFLPLQAVSLKNIDNIQKVVEFEFDYIAAPAGIIIKNSQRMAYHKFVNKINLSEEENEIVNEIFVKEGKRLFANKKFNHLIHFTGYDAYAAKLFLNIEGKKHIFVHNDMKEELKLRNNFNEQVIWEYYKGATSINVVNEEVGQKLKEDYFKGQEDIINKMDVVHNTINIDLIKERSKIEEEYLTDEISSVLNDNNITKFVNVARFSPEKGLDRLIEAYNTVRDNNPDKQMALFLIGGHGIDKDKLLNLIEMSNYTESIYFFENINPLPILRKSNLFVLSSYHEGLPMVFFESLVLNVPILSTNIPGPRAFLSQGYGNICENSLEGLITGMQDYLEGKLNEDIKELSEFNNNALNEFMNMLSK